eukprot:TRINITY_DN9048_c0_g1_i4.p1 TRINITY_DN9048_c0_g1~~TRINITY_DN9048_c0_g1_i4.p1  ORF type:complete len:286 (-),score=85.18 TRINITY_DN9048_c0_g1_i4:138-884(-)
MREPEKPTNREGSARNGSQFSPKRRKLEDDVLLKGLIGETMLSLLDHDKIVGWEGRDVVSHGLPQKVLQEKAEKVATRAVEKLRESRQQMKACEPVPVKTRGIGKSVSTTCSSSTSPSTPGKVRRFGNVTNFKNVGLPSPSQPLQKRNKMEQDQSFFGNTVVGLGTGLPTKMITRSSQIVTTTNPDMKLVQEICSFIRAKNGAASSTEIVTHFRNKVSAERLEVFKVMLKEIAVLMAGKWILKDEWKD